MTRLKDRCKQNQTLTRLCYATLLLTLSGLSHSNDLSATVTLTSDYVFRGVSFTDDPALQASVDYGYDNGLYVGIWTSSYDFGTESNQEVDYYIGYSQELSKKVTVSASAFRYTLIDEHETNYNEFQIGLSRGPLDVNAWYAHDYGGSSGEVEYYDIGFNTTLPMEAALELRAGRSFYDASIGVRDYTDYIVAVSRSFGRFNTEVRITDTNENQFGDREDFNVILSVSTTFQ